MKSSQSYLKFVEIGSCPDPDQSIVATYHVKKNPKSRLEGLGFLGSIAAESSTGTWTNVSTATEASERISGKVFFYSSDTHITKIAYPIGLFEPGNVSQLLTVIAGNAFGLADVSELKLLDVDLPPRYQLGFLGPAFGIEGIYSSLGKSTKVPVIGSIIKPKCGLSSEEHSEVCYSAWIGMYLKDKIDGVDMVKDDEALTSQASFSSDFYDRTKKTLTALQRAEDATGSKKIYVPNVTHSNALESLKRAEFVKKNGGNAVMIDFVMSGCAILQTVREAKLDLIIHGHRTLFAAMHRPKEFGVSFLVWAKLFRMIGGDQVHTGTPGLGVMSAPNASVIEICSAVRDFKTSSKSPCLPICGAGLDPLTTEPLTKILGSQVAIFAGGGVHGHPQGTREGAASMRASVNALEAGVSFETYVQSKDLSWLTKAYDHFGRFDKQSPNDKAREHM